MQKGHGTFAQVYEYYIDIIYTITHDIIIVIIDNYYDLWFLCSGYYLIYDI